MAKMLLKHGGITTTTLACVDLCGVSVIVSKIEGFPMVVGCAVHFTTIQTAQLLPSLYDYAINNNTITALT